MRSCYRHSLENEAFESQATNVHFYPALILGGYKVGEQNTSKKIMKYPQHFS